MQNFVDQNKKYEELFIQYEQSLTYLGVLFVKNKLNKGVTKCIDFMNNLMFKMCILSGDI